MNIEADSSAKCFSSEEILINSPVNKVFGILADINNWPKWQSSVSRAQINGPAEVGKRFEWKSGSMTLKSQFHTVNPDSEIGWTGTVWWIKAVHNWSLTKEKEMTRVVVKESLTGLGSSGMQKSLKEGMKKNLEELKQRAENK
jgi:uncharacterized protein YndB with AHSA1/START domain